MAQMGSGCELLVVVAVVIVGVGVLIEVGVQYERVVKDGEWFRNSFACMGEGYLQ
jgi:hypothetical protein